jgi:hypothetical protein
MAEQFQLAWEASTALASFTGLHSLADGNIWRGGEITDASPTRQMIEISYNLVFNVAPVVGDYLAFWVVGSDGNATPYRPGAIAGTVGAITAAAAIAEFLQAAGQPDHSHHWATNHGLTFQNSFLVENYRPAWQVCIRAVGEALAAAGNVVRYRYVTTQQVTV